MITAAGSMGHDHSHAMFIGDRGHLGGILFTLFAVAGQLPMSCTAQSDTAFTMSGYAELYYCYDLAEPADGLRENAFYNYNRHNEVRLFCPECWPSDEPEV